MDDLISREDVLALPRNTERDLNGKIVDETINVSDIESLPSAMQWIPCSERLPAEDVKVLVWLKESDVCGQHIRIASLGMHPIEDQGLNYLGDKAVWYGYQYWYDLDRVIAWMPLPAPYSDHLNGID